jgi:hypothetical protein
MYPPQPPVYQPPPQQLYQQPPAYPQQMIPPQPQAYPQPYRQMNFQPPLPMTPKIPGQGMVKTSSVVMTVFAAFFLIANVIHIVELLKVTRGYSNATWPVLYDVFVSVPTYIIILTAQTVLVLAFAILGIALCGKRRNAIALTIIASLLFLVSIYTLLDYIGQFRQGVLDFLLHDITLHSIFWLDNIFLNIPAIIICSITYLIGAIRFAVSPKQ